MSLTPLTSCNSSPSCIPPNLEELGVALSAVGLDGCIKSLSGDGLPVSAGGRVQNRDGSAIDPIKLPLLQKSLSASFPHLMIMNRAGAVMIAPAPAGPTARVLFGMNGSWAVGDVPAQVCYDPSDVCGNCSADWIAGFKEVTDSETGETSICIVRINPLELPNIASEFWNSSQSVNITGAGSSQNPRAAAVRISNDEGNSLELRTDGLYVRSSNDFYYEWFGVDPILSI